MTMENIEWSDVLDYEGLYEVSNSGLVRNARTGNLIKPFKTERGYLIVKLFRRDIGGKNFKVHRLVATAFLGLPVEGDQVNHLDFDKGNNHVSNLEWCTGEANWAHFCEFHEGGCGTAPRGSDVGGSRLTEADVLDIITLRHAHSQRELARRFGVSRTTIQDIEAGRSWGWLTGREVRNAA